jgi:hypothetical protein
MKNRTVAVATGALIVVALGASSAWAASQITSSDIKNQTIQSVDIAPGGVGSSEVQDRSLGMGDLSSATQDKINSKKGDNGSTGKDGAKGDPGTDGTNGAKGDPGTDGTNGKDATYEGAKWSIIDRNVIGNGDSYLRAGPDNAPTGDGSLGIRTGGSGDKSAFGNQTTFAGQKIKDISAIGFSVFTTGENNTTNAGNLPNIALEIDPNVAAVNSSYSTLNYVPGAAAANTWTTFDGTSDTQGKWGLSGSAFNGTQCSINGAMCTWTELQAYLNDGGDDAVVTYSLAINKGRDYAFSGAVDDLVFNNTTYNFEPSGVYSTTN